MNKTTVHLGYEVGSGQSVEIPVRHMAITGQTQEAGKTTTLEAVMARSGLRGLTFVTKRGEGSFEGARRIQPYFREQTDWQFVASILEASRGEKLKFERAWIIRASKGARTLADVQHNVRAAMEKARGMSADVYLTLDAYLDVVVPQVAAVKWAPALELAPGVNAMDLGDMPIEMQHLVIRSAMNWVLERERGTVIVVPEAWKFIPQGRGTPVKLAAEAFIRQGAALGNYLWLDSQDLGGIEKAILRSISVWLLGVQREANEIKRTLDNIPAIPSKPKPSEVATLKLGEFFACWSDKRVRTYVQPTWMTEQDARFVAIGVGTKVEGRSPGVVMPERPTRKEPEMCEKHEQLARELSDVREKLKQAESDSDRQGVVARAAEARAEEFRQQASSAQALGRAIAGILPAGGGTGPAAVVDEDAIVRRVLAQIPAGGAVPVTVTPPEKLRKDFQREEADRMVAAARGLDVLGKRILKLLVAVETPLSQRTIAERLGRAVNSGGSMAQLGESVKGLANLGLVSVHPKRGVLATLREKVSGDLSAYQPTEGDIEAVYQGVLYVLATGDEAAA